MPTATNPSPDRVEVHVADRTFYIEPGKSADVSDEEAKELEGHTVLKVQSSAPARSGSALPKQDTPAAAPQEENKP